LNEFHSIVSNANLHDLSMEVYKYNWAQRLGKHDAIEKKLNHALTTLNWIDLSPYSN